MPTDHLLNSIDDFVGEDLGSPEARSAVMSFWSEQTDIPLVCHELDGTIAYLNKASARLLNRPRREILEQSLSEHFGDEWFAQHQELVTAATPDQPSFETKLRFVVDGEDHLYRIDTELLYGSDGAARVACLALIDITEDDQAHAALQRANQALSESNRPRRVRVRCVPRPPRTIAKDSSLRGALAWPPRRYRRRTRSRLSRPDAERVWTNASSHLRPTQLLASDHHGTRTKPGTPPGSSRECSPRPRGCGDGGERDRAHRHVANHRRGSTPAPAATAELDRECTEVPKGRQWSRYLGRSGSDRFSVAYLDTRHRDRL